jgi:peroxiredoxin
MAIAVNEVAPEFELVSNQFVDGKPGKIKLSDLRGKPVVLAFYPLDFSPVCTTENTCFRNDLEQFSKVGAQVLGISVDSHWTHKAFAESLKLTYPLLADFQPRGAVASAYGLFNAEKGFTKRATVLIDKSGKVAWVKEHDGARSDEELLAELRKLA